MTQNWLCGMINILGRYIQTFHAFCNDSLIWKQRKTRVVAEAMLSSIT